MASNDNASLNVTKFREIIDEYRTAFTSPPKTGKQIARFCKDKQYSYKYGELNPFFIVWCNQQQQRTTETAGNDFETPSQEDAEREIDWTAFWDEYNEQYGNAPKNPVHLWNFAKEEKSVAVKYKEARNAFDRITKDRAAAVSSPQTPIEGRRQSVTSLTDLSLKNAARCTSSASFDTQTVPRQSADDSGKVEIRLKITKYTSDEELDGIKTLFLECLAVFRASILHDPRNPVQLFNFINEDTTYRTRYVDVKSCYTYAAKHDWFTPMKRMKKVVSTDGAAEAEVAQVVLGDANDCDAEEEGVQFVLQVDHAKIEQKRQQQNQEEEKETVAHDVMLDDQFDALLVQYTKKYDNAPRNASQMMNFAATEIGQNFKYKACRVAFQRWQKQRGGVMPKVTTPIALIATAGAERTDDEEDDVQEAEVPVSPGAQAVNEEEEEDADSDACDDLNSNEDDE